MNSITIALTLLSAILNKCNSQDGHLAPIDEYVINGEDVGKGRWPWILSLEVLDPEFRHTCGATHIDNQHAMTAAHCLEGRYPDMPFRVAVGCSDRGINGTGSDREDTVNIVGAVWHENYTNCVACPYGWPEDIALMYLERPVEFNEYVQPATLGFMEHDDVYINSTCFVAGWGKLHGTDDDVPVILQEAEISVISNERCINMQPAEELPRINDGHICMYDERVVTPEEKRNVCNGDSGSPLMCDYEGSWHVLGSASWVIPGPYDEDRPPIDDIFYSTCDPAYPGVYNKATYYMEWIEEQLADDSWQPDSFF